MQYNLSVQYYNLSVQYICLLSNIGRISASWRVFSHASSHHFSTFPNTDGQIKAHPTWDAWNSGDFIAYQIQDSHESWHQCHNCHEVRWYFPSIAFWTSELLKKSHKSSIGKTACDDLYLYIKKLLYIYISVYKYMYIYWNIYIVHVYIYLHIIRINVSPTASTDQLAPFYPRQKGSRVISPRPCSSRRHLLRPVACWKTLARLPNSSTNTNIMQADQTNIHFVYCIKNQKICLWHSTTKQVWLCDNTPKTYCIYTGWPIVHLDRT